MNGIEEKIVGRFVRGWDGKLANTESHDNTLYLHGNAIAWRNDETGEVWITNAGWHTKTTQSRLNAVLQSLGVEGRVFTKKGRQYLERREDDEMVIHPMTQWIEVRSHQLSETLTQLQEKVSHG
jgi:hypothetical protein